ELRRDPPPRQPAGPEQGMSTLCRRARWRLAMAVVALLAAPAARAADAPAAKGTGERVDAAILRDLDLLASPDYTRDRDVAGRMAVLERLRLLEMLRLLEGHPAQALRPLPRRDRREAR